MSEALTKTIKLARDILSTKRDVTNEESRILAQAVIMLSARLPMTLDGHLEEAGGFTNEESRLLAETVIMLSDLPFKTIRRSLGGNGHLAAGS